MRRCYQRPLRPALAGPLAEVARVGNNPVARREREAVHPVLHLVRFRAVGAGFDAALRDALGAGFDPAPGLRAVFAGRIGPGDDGERLLASVWDDDEALQAAVDADRAPIATGAAALHGTQDGPAEHVSVAVVLEPVEAARISIMRVVTGITRQGQLDDYLEDARTGMRADRAVGEGPLALYLGVDPPDRFVTLSLWGGWSHVETATGADHEHVDRTRHAERLATWSVEHYELIPGLAVVDPARARTDDEAPASALAGTPSEVAG